MEESKNELMVFKVPITIDSEELADLKADFNLHIRNALLAATNGATAKVSLTINIKSWDEERQEHRAINDFNYSIKSTKTSDIGGAISKENILVDQIIIEDDEVYPYNPQIELGDYIL